MIQCISLIVYAICIIVLIVTTVWCKRSFSRSISTLKATEARYRAIASKISSNRHNRKGKILNE